MNLDQQVGMAETEGGQQSHKVRKPEESQSHNELFTGYVSTDSSGLFFESRFNHKVFDFCAFSNLNIIMFPHSFNALLLQL